MQNIHLLMLDIANLGVYHEQNVEKISSKYNLGFRYAVVSNRPGPNRIGDYGYILYTYDQSEWDIGSFELFISTTGETSLTKIPS